MTNPSNGTSKALRFRMANQGDSITSESRSAFSVSWQVDGKLTAKYQDPNSTGGVATLSSDPLVGAQDISLVINPSDTNSFAYNFFGVARTLNPLSYDVYVNGSLFNVDAGPNPDFDNGLEFTLGKSAGNYDPALGLGRIGIVGSSSGDFGPDYLFDNVILDTIPEPSSVALLLGSVLLLAGSARRS